MYNTICPRSDITSIFVDVFIHVFISLFSNEATSDDKSLANIEKRSRVCFSYGMSSPGAEPRDERTILIAMFD